ncbi:hypothetical protein F0562_011842 [Nyssa sinensis]|uniref:Glycosyltransferase n=1 Tax=Nyssa sinensis TaxID=561372 RepID=A0A5J4ZQI4_9ASTE|nr:hypothetical protein F0562_011842 [Nyssa sinensis]
MARLFAVGGHHVTIITTPSNASILQNSINKDITAGHQIALHVVPFPSKEVGLPDGLENFFSVTDLEAAGKLYHAMTLLRQNIEEFIDTRRPDCIVSDMFHPWTADVAVRLDIPRLVFQGVCMFAQSLKDAVRRPDSPHLKVQSDYDPFVIPGLPDPITMTRSQLPDYVRTQNGYTQLMEQWREAELKSYGVLVNNFYELDSAYTEHYKKVMGHKIFHIGPAALIHRNAGDKVERGHRTVVGEQECLSWLSSKKPNSVLYVCFGSGCRFPDEQLMEIACGLEASGHQFIWVVLGKDDDEEEEEREKWLPEGFDEKINGRGMMVKGWAPQVLGIGMEVGVEDWNLWVDAGKKVIRRESIEKCVRRLMDDGDEGVVLMRQKAKELGEKARRAVEEGGSSHRNLTLLIEELKQLRDHKSDG